MSTDSTNKKSRPLYKKPALWIIIAAVITVAAAGILTGSLIKGYVKSYEDTGFDLDSTISQAIKEYNLPDDPEYDIVATESHVIYGKRKNGNKLTVYMTACCQLYSTDNPLGIVEESGGGWCPTAITFEVRDDGSYKLLEYWESEDGSYYASSIKEKFPIIYAYLAIANVTPPPQPDTSEVYEHFNAPKTVTFVSPDNAHLFCDEKGDAVLTLNTETSDATLSVNGKEIFTDFYSFFNFDEDGDTVTEYIYLCDVDNLPNNRWEYDFTIIDENTLCVTNLPEKPVFTRVEE